jgi:hypothetical protein
MALDVDKLKNVPNFAEAIKQAGGDDLLQREEKANRSEFKGIKPTKVADEFVVDASKYDLALQARAALSSHVATVAEDIRNGSGWLMEHQQAFSPYVQKLKEIRLPDIKVALKNKKLEIPWDIFDYANKVPQAAALDLLKDILGQDALEQLYKYSRLSGQEDKPTLWLVQKLYVEIEANAQHVNTLHQDAATKEAMDSIPQQQHELASEAIKQVFGSFFHEQSLQPVARVNQTSAYAIFVLVFHEIMRHEEKIRSTKAVTTLWDNVLKPKS